MNERTYIHRGGRLAGTVLIALALLATAHAQPAVGPPQGFSSLDGLYGFESARHAPVETPNGNDALGNPPLVPGRDNGPVWFDDSLAGPPPNPGRGWGPVYFGLESLFLTRYDGTGTTSVPLVYDNTTIDPVSGLPVTPLFAAPNFQHSFGAAPLITLGMYLNPTTQIEGNYWGYYTTVGTATITGNANLQLPGFFGLLQPGFANLDSVDITNSTFAESAEVNFMKNGFGGLVFRNRATWSALVGARYFGIRDQYSLTGTSFTVDPFTNQRVVNGTNQYAVNTTNTLLGGQFGLRWQLDLDRISFDATAKLGGFNNAGAQSQQLWDVINGTIARPGQRDGSGAAFVTDVSTHINYMHNGWLNIRFGYHMFFFDGLALGPNNLDFGTDVNSGSNYNRSGSMLLHGPSVGAIVRF